MKLFCRSLLAFVAAATLASTAVAQEKPSVASLAFLTGSWGGTSSSGATAEEIFSTAEGGVLLSAGREFQGGKCVFFDLVVFTEKDGVLSLTPHPNGQRSPHVFPLVKFEAGAKRTTFENKANSFPKTFTYELTAPDRLRITLTGEMKGQPMTETYDLQRAK